jgi:hypothetical protein
MLVWGPLYQRAGGATVFRMCWLVGSLAFLAALAFVAVSRDKKASAS